MKIGYLLIGFILSLVVFIASLFLYPEWQNDYRTIISLIALAIIGSFGFLANFRQATATTDKKLKSLALPQTLEISILNSNDPRVKSIDGGSRSQLPDTPPDFIGRDEELDTMSRFVRKNQAPIIGVYGMGGVGKTTLAIAFAHSLKNLYPDGQFFLDVRGTDKEYPLTPQEITSELIKWLSPETYSIGDKNDDRHLRALFEGKKVLILLDNVRDNEQISTIIPPAGSLLIITSRNNIYFPGIHYIDLRTLSESEAILLIKTIEPRLENISKQLAEKCGYIPLAIRVTSSFLKMHHDYNPNEYLTKLNNPKRRLHLTGCEDVIKLSYDLLTNEHQEKWRKLAVFQGSFTIEEAANIWVSNIEDTKEILSFLVASSLVEFDEINNHYYLHDLVHLLANNLLQGIEREIVENTLSRQYLSDMKSEILDSTVYQFHEILQAPVIRESSPIETKQPRMIKIIFKPTGDRLRDVRRLKSVYGRLRMNPGIDRFAFIVFEGEGHYQLEFPTDTTYINPGLISKIAELVGTENILVENIQIH